MGGTEDQETVAGFPRRMLESALDDDVRELDLNNISTGSWSVRSMCDASRLMLFKPRMAVDKEMKELEARREECEEYAGEIVKQGEELVQLARNGQNEAVIRIAMACREGELLAWTVARMFRAACLSGNCELIEFMCKNGVDKSHPGLRSLIHELVEDYENVGQFLSVCKLLKDFGFDINSMRRGDGLTPLHIVCSNARIDLFKALIVLGADIHAVANDDSMPLGCARAAEAAAETKAEWLAAQQIVLYLKQLGATESIVYVSCTG